MNSADFFKNRIVLADLGAAVMALLFFAADSIQKRSVDPHFLLPVLLSFAFLFLLYYLNQKIFSSDEALSGEARFIQKQLSACRIKNLSDPERTERIPAEKLRKGEFFLVRAGEQIPADGEIVKGTASVDESAITGESAPVLREAGGDLRFVTCGTVLLSDMLIVRVTKSGASGLSLSAAERAALLSELAPSRRFRYGKLLCIFFLIFVLAAFLLSAAILDGVSLTLWEALLSAAVILVALTPLASSSFFQAADLHGMNALFSLRTMPKESRVLLKLEQLRTLFVGKDMLAAAPRADLRDAFEAIRRLGVNVVLLTDTDATGAAALAAEAGAGSFISGASLSGQLDAIRSAQQKGQICGMFGASLSDAPALAQADVAVTPDNAVPEAREAANLIDLDSRPEKILDIIRCGKRLLSAKRCMLRTASFFELLKLIVLLFFLLHGSVLGLSAALLLSLLQAVLLYLELRRCA